MPINSINKVISMFLAGCLALGIFIGLASLNPSVPFKSVKDALPEGALAIVVIATAVALGVAIDGMAELAVRGWIRRESRRADSSVLRSLARGRMLKETLRWRDILDQSIAENSPLRSVCDELKISEEAGDPPFSIAAAITLKNANPQQFDWVVSHYATFYLASNVAFVFILAIPLSMAIFSHASGFGCGSLFILEGGLVAATYAALSISADRYLYTYLASFRFATLFLIEADTRK